MRYLRLMVNAALGGVLYSTYLAILVFQVNPQLPLLSPTGASWLGAVIAFYAPYLGVGLFLLTLARDVFASRPLRPGWISVRLLAWLGATGGAAAAVLTWANLSIFSAVMSADAADRMRDGAWATSLAAGVLLVLALLRYSFGRRGSGATGVLLGVVLSLSVIAPLWLRGPGEAKPPLPRRDPATGRTDTSIRSVAPSFAPHVRVLALDGASLGFIRQRVAAGQLSNFGRLLDRGASIDLATIHPTQAEPVWVAAATGKLPQTTGVRSSRLYRVTEADSEPADVLPDYCFAEALRTQGFITDVDLTAASVHARPVWDILADYGIASGIAGWPLTYPAHAERGYVISDQFDEAASSPLRLYDSRAGDPTTAVDITREIFDDWQARPWHEVLPALPFTMSEPAGLSRARWDQAYTSAARELEDQFAPRLTAVRYEGLDAFGHTYLRDAAPELFADPRRVDPQRSVLDQYYEYIDGEIGDAMLRLEPGDLLIVASGFGMEPAPLSKRLLARLLGGADRDYTGTHEAGPDGFLLAYGTNVATGQFRRGAVVDLAPTLLYYMGVAVGRDMDGFARTDLFAATFVAEHPVKYVETHER